MTSLLPITANTVGSTSSWGTPTCRSNATALKVGTTSLVLNLIEKKIFPKDVLIKDTVWALKKISHDQGFSWLVERHSGGTISAIDIQRRYLELARRHLDDLDEDGEWILEEWETVLDDLDRDPMSLTDRVDWVAKKYLLETFMEAEGLSWDDPWLQSLDLEYHNIDIDSGTLLRPGEKGGHEACGD